MTLHNIYDSLTQLHVVSVHQVPKLIRLNFAHTCPPKTIHVGKKFNCKIIVPHFLSHYSNKNHE